MPDDINNFDTKDEGLQAIFGDRFQDMTVARSLVRLEANTTKPKKAAQKPKDEPAKWNPPKPAPDWLDRLKASVVWAAGYGSLNFLIFYWQLAGLMDDSIAIPCMWACMALAGFGVGKNAFGRVR